MFLHNENVEHVVRHFLIRNNALLLIYTQKTRDEKWKRKCFWEIDRLQVLRNCFVFSKRSKEIQGKSKKLFTLVSTSSLSFYTYSVVNLSLLVFGISFVSEIRCNLKVVKYTSNCPSQREFIMRVEAGVNTIFKSVIRFNCQKFSARSKLVLGKRYKVRLVRNEI